MNHKENPVLSSVLLLPGEKHSLEQQAELLKARNTELMAEAKAAARERHDHRHHLCAVYAFLCEGDVRKAMEYLETLIPASRFEHQSVYCSHPVIDAFLHYYKKLCESKSIAFTSSVQTPAVLPVLDTDLSVLFGNLLENACEACVRQRSAYPYISVRGRCKAREFLLRVENSMDSAVTVNKGRFLSSKTGSGGIGTGSIEDVVSRYNGTVVFEPSGRTFCVSVILPLETLPPQ